MSATCNLCAGPVDPERDRRYRKDGHDVLLCPACGLLFRADPPDTAELLATYGEDYFSADAGDTKGQGYLDYLGDAALHRLNARKRLARLEQLAPPNGSRSLLDVGAAAGFFVAEARERGWDAEGIDIAESMTAHARDELGVSVATTTLAALEREPESTSVVTMWDYLEHAVDPSDDVGRARELLEPGGLLALSTGDAASLAARLSGRRWHLLTPRHHLYFFTSGTLRRLLEGHGFRVERLAYDSAVYSLDYVVYKLRTMIGLAALERAAERLRASRLSGVTLPLSLRDIVTVHARRL